MYGKKFPIKSSCVIVVSRKSNILSFLQNNCPMREQIVLILLRKQSQLTTAILAASFKFIGPSTNGRSSAFGALCLGSNPSGPASFIAVIADIARHRMIGILKHGL
jgi:hypothetical protein